MGAPLVEIWGPFITSARPLFKPLGATAMRNKLDQATLILLARYQTLDNQARYLSFDGSNFYFLTDSDRTENEATAYLDASFLYNPSKSVNFTDSLENGDLDFHTCKK